MGNSAIPCVVDDGEVGQSIDEFIDKGLCGIDGGWDGDSEIL